jgi:ATP-dependent Zn protease
MENLMNRVLKQIALVMLIVLILAVVFVKDINKTVDIDSLQYSDFIRKVNDKKITQIVIFSDNRIEGEYLKGEDKVRFETVIPYSDPALVGTLLENGVEVDGKSLTKISF